MRGIIITATALLIGIAPACARHVHAHRHSQHIVTRVHHHREVQHEVTSRHKTSKHNLVEDSPKPAPKDVDPEALAWAPLKEIFGERPRKMTGKLVVNDHAFEFVSGGHGWSIPWGHWAITPDDVGRWGARHGAIGLNHGDDIPDPKLHRGREGVEIHAANHDATAGCVGIRDRYSELKKLVLGMIDQFGHAFLHITPHAVAITPSKYLAPTVTIGKVVAASDDDDEPPRHHRRHRHMRMASR